MKIIDEYSEEEIDNGIALKEVENYLKISRWKRHSKYYHQQCQIS